MFFDKHRWEEDNEKAFVKMLLNHSNPDRTTEQKMPSIQKVIHSRKITIEDVHGYMSYEKVEAATIAKLPDSSKRQVEDCLNLKTNYFDLEEPASKYISGLFFGRPFRYKTAKEGYEIFDNLLVLENIYAEGEAEQKQQCREIVDKLFRTMPKALRKSIREELKALGNLNID
jgi:hypothetical protein